MGQATPKTGNETKGAAKKGAYLYAIVPESEIKTKDLGEGLEKSSVYTVREGKLAAIVSDLPTPKELKPERRNLSAHQNVLKRVLDASSVVLPVSFGTVADSAEGVRALLKKYEEEFTEQMEEVRGKAETVVRLAYAPETPGIFEYVMERRSPELKQLRDRLFAGGREASREEKIDLGQAVEGALNAARDEFAEQVEDVLSAHCSSIKRLPPRNERELARLACLVERDVIGEFDNAVGEAAKLFDDHFTFEETGPFPPYDFTELHLKV
jgi:hypothetical protein